MLNPCYQEAASFIASDTEEKNDTIEDITEQELGPGFLHNSTGEQVILVDWKKKSNNSTPGFAEATGHALYSVLVGGAPCPGCSGGYKGTFLGVIDAQGQPARPLHFIAHSFGTVVNSEAIQRLAVLQNPSVKVEQMTTLDPHDWDEAFIPVDGGALLPDVQIWNNINFADNYYTSEGGGASDNPHGRPILGAQNYDLTQLDGFKNGILWHPHARVHAFYLGTIDQLKLQDTDGLEITSSWYDSFPRDHVGYAHSRIGGKGNRIPTSCKVNPASPVVPTICENPYTNNNGLADVHVNEPPTAVFDGHFSTQIGEVDSRPGFRNKPEVAEWTAGDAAAVVGLGGVPDSAFETHLTYVPSNATSLRFWAAQTRNAVFGADDSLHVLVDGQEQEIGQTRVSDLSSAFQVAQHAIPLEFQGRSVTMLFDLRGNGILDSTVWIDNIEFVNASTSIELTISPVPVNGRIEGTGISCGAGGTGDCSEPYNSGANVTLTANPAIGFQVGTWTGCTPINNNTQCTVSMTQARTVTVTFTQITFLLTVSPVPTNGFITATGISCGAGGTGDCSEPYNSGATATLTANPATGFQVATWTGCTPINNNTQCAVQMTQVRTVTVTFTLQPDGTVNDPSGGAVVSDTAGTGGIFSVSGHILSVSTDVFIDVLPDPGVGSPVGFTANGTAFVDIRLDPNPGTLPSPGATITLPLKSPMPKGTPLSLFKFFSATGLFQDLKIVGFVDTGGNTATFSGVTSFSTFVAFQSANHPPTAVNDSYSVNEDAMLTVVAPGVLGNDTDEDNNPLTALLVSGPSNGGLTLNADGSFTYTPNPNFNGTDSFIYRANDGQADSNDVATVTITINAVNDAPVLNNSVTMLLTAINEDDQNSGGDTVVAILGTGAGGYPISDADNGALRGIAVTAADNSNGSWQYSANGGTSWTAFGVVSASMARLLTDDAVNKIRFVPNADFNGTAAISFRAWDRTSGTNGGTADTTVNGGTSAFSSVIATAQITVLPVNDPPVANTDTKSTFEDTVLTFVATDLIANDSPGPANESSQTLMVTAVSSPSSAGGTVLLSGGNITYSPAPNFNGTDSFQYTVCDNGIPSLCATGTVNVIVTAVNDPPSFVKGANQTVPEDAGPQTVVGWATAISAGPPDESSQIVNFIVLNNNNGLFSVQPAISATGTLTYTPAPNANGVATVTVQLHDNGGALNGGVDTSPPQTFTITVLVVNDPPSFVKGANQTVLEDAGAQTVVGWATAISAGPPDEVGQVLTFLVSNNNNALFSVQPAISANGALTYTPAPNANGLATVTVLLQDNGGTANGGVDTSAPQTFTITVTPVNDAPVVSPVAPIIVDEGSSIGIALDSIVSDVETPGNQIVWSGVSSVPNVATVSINTATRVATITGVNGNGTSTVTLTGTDRGDPNGCSGGPPACSGPLSASINVAVTVKNVAPTISVSGNTTVDEGSQLTININAPDAGKADTVTLSASGLPKGASFSQKSGNPATGTLAWTPAYTQSGSYGVTLTAVDDDGGTATSILNLTVNEAGQPVIAVVNSNDRTVSLIDAQLNQVVRVEAVGKKPVADSFFDLLFDGFTPPVKLYVAERGTDDEKEGKEGKDDDDDDHPDKAKGIIQSLVGPTAPTPANAFEFALGPAIQVGNRPEALAINPAGSQVWVTNRNEDSISIVGRATDTLIATVPLVVKGSSKTKGKDGDKLKIGQKPAAIAFSPDGQFAYVVARNSNNLVIVDTTKAVVDPVNAILTYIYVGNKPVGLAVDPSGRFVYVVNRNGNRVAVVDVSGLPSGAPAVKAQILVGEEPEGIALLPDGTKLYVASGETNSVWVFQVLPTSPFLTFLSAVPVGEEPSGITITRPGSFIDGEYAYVANREDNTVSVIDTTNDTVVATIKVGKGPKGLAAGVIPTAP